MGRNKKATQTGWLIFGFAFVAPALLPVILTLNFGALGSSGPQPPSAARDIFKISGFVRLDRCWTLKHKSQELKAKGQQPFFFG
jgi:hypothetical protein